MGEVSEKVAIITGGGKGIGRTLAEAFARAGAAVAITGRTASALEETVAGIRAAGGTAHAHPGDVSDAATVEGMVGAVLRQCGAIDILINNAGIEGPTAPVHEVDPAAWDEVMAIKVRGAFLMTRAVAPHMIARKSGHILFISALGGGLRAYPLRAPYAVSNAGALALMQTVAAELGPHGIRVNAITPGPVKGERLDRVFRNRAQQLGTTPEAIAQGLAGKMLNRRLVDAADIARAALFLCSPAADSIVGQSLNMTGGIEILF
jgi:NAD(P)-dependent dehydrogenase (short-subunit alcohol dehydrogenase family)